MALFDNVNYEYYTTTLGRSAIPAQADFDAYKLENIQAVKKILQFIKPLEDDGIDKGVCLMIERDYLDAQTLAGNGDLSISSESLGGHSVTYAGRAQLAELNAKSTAAAKLDALRLFCDVTPGVI